MHRGWLASLLSLAVFAPCAHADDDDTRYFIPQLLDAQYTLVAQHQYSLTSPYASSLSLLARGDEERSHTFGAYFGVPLARNLQFYFDMEMFKGEPVSNGTGLGGGANGDVVHAGSANLGKGPYVARRYLRYLIPLDAESRDVDRSQDQLPGKESTRHLEFKLGKMAVSDDFDKNRYADSARTQFFNVAPANNVAWDFAADTRGYTNGFVAAYAEPTWVLRYGVYQMPAYANGQTLEWPVSRARGEQVEFTWQPGGSDGWAARLLAFRNVARMGIYRDAIAIAQANGTVPDIRADDRDGRHKYGFGANTDFPLADDGESGLFARAGWNDGKTESFAFTEADDTLSAGAQLSGVHWNRKDDHIALALTSNGLSRDHRDYLALGGSGFLLGDGRLNYARESAVELQYRARIIDHVEITPDFEFIRAPGYNKDRGPAKFVGARLHLEM